MRSGNGEGPRIPGAARSERPVLRTEWRTCVMSCDKFREQIPECLAGRLDAAAREKLIAHVDTCAGCRSDLAEMGAVWRGLVSLPVAEPDAGMRPRFLEVLGAYQAGMAETPAAPLRSGGFAFGWGAATAGWQGGFYLALGG